jgi:hypothetical protein
VGCGRRKSCGISGRRTDRRCCFIYQCAHWWLKHDSGARIAGIDLERTRSVTSLAFSMFEIPETAECLEGLSAYEACGFMPQAFAREKIKRNYM